MIPGKLYIVENNNEIYYKLVMYKEYYNFNFFGYSDAGDILLFTGITEQYYKDEFCLFLFKNNKIYIDKSLSWRLTLISK